MNALPRILARFTFLRYLALACVLACAASPALAAKTYSDNGDGTVADPTTGLTWMRCAIGLTWDGATCTGTTNTYTWDQANALTGTVTFAGQSDWRVPNIRELLTIVDRTAYNPAIDSVAFPDGGWVFWSNSTWVVTFDYGIAVSSNKTNSYPVRLVRAGQSFGLLDMARPSTDYVDRGDGTVTHTPTRLTWQRCAVGQTWTGSTCSGTASVFTWDAAKVLTSSFAGQTDWRLPTEEELLSLVDYSKSPAINVTLFPNTPGLVFWSASVYAGGSLGIAWTAWLVNFSDGSAYSGFSKAWGAPTERVRLVRAVQSFDLLTLTVRKTGTGQVNSRGPGIVCGTVCSSGYYPGDMVTLNATPSANFISWGGACAGTTATCIVTMDAAKSVTASFIDSRVVSVWPFILTFATQNIGSTSAAQTVNLRNTGGLVLNVSSIMASGDFTIGSSTCGATLAPASSCSFSVTFTPTVVGARSGSIVIPSDAVSSPNTVSLSGTGAAVALVSLSPASLSFVSQDVWTNSITQTIDLTNSGGGLLGFASITHTSGDFAVANNCFDLAPSGSCRLWVTFTPTAAGTRTGTITITSNAVGSPHSVSLSGTIGTLTPPTPPICTLTASPVVIAAGSASTLTASCTPAATSYTWTTNSGFGSGVSSGAVSPARPTVYTVVASNAAGSNTASTAVYVCNTAPSQIYAGQTLVGTGASELFDSGIGNDTIAGGAGIDTVIYNCNRSSFTLSKTASGWSVSSVAEGIDTLTNIDRIQFPNETLALDISGNAGQAYRVYQAAFNRTPDNAGLKYWIGVMDNGASLNDVAAGFINSAEFQSLYGANPTNPEFVTKLYSNVLHRAPDQGGYDYWVGLLNNNQISRIQTLVNFSESPENQAGVIGAILNGIDLMN